VNDKACRKPARIAVNQRKRRFHSPTP
jgi:hypothetical protein